MHKRYGPVIFALSTWEDMPMRTGITLLLFTCLTSPLLAYEIPGVETGRALFESPALGSNHKSCQQCHPGGQGLKEVGAYDDATLKEMINFCIRDALKGVMLDPESQELTSMLLYVRQLAAQ